jgi:hypothetical protein
MLGKASGIRYLVALINKMDDPTIGGGACRQIRLEPYLNRALVGYALPEFRL